MRKGGREGKRKEVRKGGREEGFVRVRRREREYMYIKSCQSERKEGDEGREMGEKGRQCRGEAATLIL